MIEVKLDELADKKGTLVSHSPWLTVTQEMIEAFADATGDHQWIHIDIERAKKESPWKSPIAHGYLTVSLISRLNPQALKVTGPTATINYGLNKLRFPSAVKSGSDIRTKVQLLDVNQVDEHRYMASYLTTVEIKGEDKPACVAENLVMYVI
ncbi:MaoC family dehydratase [Marinobacter sp. M216]|uniref:MaoC family dehydratase n=1 Tax=Marinobacter albus TaxID=3030833 RepID=A0ABT7HDW8_9GAMM|nr:MULTISPECIES: MaoC family dehydratase [unclassified Marinobacter]MBW7471983.1 MaoC family dehydratase [Marinobacter sp. F4218]MDK9558553.1 MaoC family dehydratase [Marinobacter sp. M216]